MYFQCFEDFQSKKFTKMLDIFDDDEDVQDVYHNAEMPDEEEY